MGVAPIYRNVGFDLLASFYEKSDTYVDCKTYYGDSFV